MVEKTSVVQMVGGRIASIEVIAGQHVGTKLIVSAGTFVIGRDAEADLHLVNEPGVSRLHAKIVAERDRFRLVDNESRNGTLLNGAPARSELLYDGDLIDIAQCRILFRHLGGERRPPPSSPPAPIVPTLPPVAASSWTAPPAVSYAPTMAPAPGADTSGRGIVIGTMVVTIVFVLGGGVIAWLLADRSSGATMTGTSPTSSATATAPPVVAAPVPAPPPPPDAPTPAPPPEPTGPVFVEVKSENTTEILRATERGRVQGTPTAVGADVSVGDVLLVLAGEVGNAADLATRRESIAALESIAEGNEAAAKQLATEKAELRALMNKAPPKKVLSAAAGTLVALDVKVGEMVRQGQVIGRLETKAAVLRASVTADQTVGVQAGTTCDLRTEGSGLAKGTIREVIDRGAGAFEWVIDAGTTQQVTAIRCPSTP
jgi:biotin carboxyl carrier protein